MLFICYTFNTIYIFLILIPQTLYIIICWYIMICSFLLRICDFSVNDLVHNGDHQISHLFVIFNLIHLLLITHTLLLRDITHSNIQCLEYQMDQYQIVVCLFDILYPYDIMIILFVIHSSWYC